MDRPCAVVVFTNRTESTRWNHWRNCVGGFNPVETSDRLTVGFSNRETAIKSLSVCTASNSHGRIKGLQVYGEEINEDGTTSNVPSASTRERPNCATWHRTLICPDRSLATGLVVHYNANNRGPDEATGLQLVCRNIVTL